MGAEVPIAARFPFAFVFTSSFATETSNSQKSTMWKAYTKITYSVKEIIKQKFG